MVTSPHPWRHAETAHCQPRISEASDRSGLLRPKVLLLYYLIALITSEGFPSASADEESACSAGHMGSIPGSGRAPGGGNGNPLQYSCLGNPMDRGAWWATVHEGRKELDTAERLSTHITSE